MKPTLLPALALLLALLPVALRGGAGGPQDLADLRAEAEALVLRGGYARAHELYARAATLELAPAERRWVRMRLADTAWRADAAAPSPDPGAVEEARRELEAVVAEIRREDERDEAWVEALESLGDLHWTGQRRDWQAAWEHYSRALEHWARSTELERARERYLSIVWRASQHEGWDVWLPWRRVDVPIQVLRDALGIAVTAEERARAHFLLAKAHQESGDPRAARRHHDAALEGGRAHAWHDDALYGYAQWLEGSGRVRRADGERRVEPDFARAVELYRELLETYREGESRWRDDAARRVRDITAPRLRVRVERTFPTGSPIAFQLSWRNLDRARFALYRVDLVDDLRGKARTPPGDPADLIDLAGREAVLAFERTLESRGPHVPVDEQVRLERELPAGAYVLVATSGGERAQTLLLASDAAIVLHAGRGSSLAWVVDARTGAPLGEAEVVLWEARQQPRDARWRWDEHRGRAGADGLAILATPGDDGPGGATFLAAARRGDQQAFATVGSWWDGPARGWRVQAWTDRPAYRPEDTVHWKVQGRRFDGARYSTPEGERLAFTLRDPRGGEVQGGALELDAFGSAWSELPLSAAMPLGEYSIELRAGEEWIAGATLFRLEELRLPEFEVRVDLMEPGEERRSRRLGDTLVARVQADSLSGGPVAGAEVEVVVTQAPHVVGWRPRAPFPWLERADAGTPWIGGGTEVLRASLRTDAGGRARLEIPTPPEAETDLRYTIQARVRDLSRREVSGSGSVHVGRQSHYVFARAEGRLHRPGDTVEVRFRTQDAGGEAVAASGTVEVARERWVEVWVDPTGREVDGDEVRRRFGRAEIPGIPPAPGWRLLRRGFEREVLSTRPIASGEDGEARTRFRPEQEGVYRVIWRGLDEDGAPVAGDTAVWVVTDRTTLLQWRRGEVELIVDRETLRAGEEALVMVSTATSGGHVLLTVAGERLHGWEVLEMRGNARLVRVPLDERHVPNTFLCAVAVREGEAWQAREELQVPPVEQFLEIRVELPEGEVPPGSESEVRVVARGHDGEPVRAQVSLSIFDEAVLAIQEPYATDPREHYHGQPRPLAVRLSSSFQWRRWGRLVRDAEGRLVDERELRLGALRRGRAAPEDAGLATRPAGLRAESGDFQLDLAEAAPMALEARGDEGKRLAQAGEEPALVVRTDFRASALWRPDLVTGDDGTASVRVRWPQSLTRWRASARAATQQARFGMGEATARTSLPLTARLQAPRFFVAGDLAAVSGVFDNRTDAAMRVRPELSRDGAPVADAGFGEDPPGAPEVLEIPAGGQARVDWFVRLEAPGETTFRLSARGAQHADSMERRFTIWPRGIDQLVARSGKLPAGGGTVRFELPADRRAGSTRASIQLAPSLATAMLDALPYLIDYPYGCTEQTMSRFLPAVIVERTLVGLGLDADAVAGRAFGGIEPTSAGAIHPEPGVAGLAKLDEVVRQGLERLYDAQRDDGGWGWWKGGEADPFMSAYVVWGLALAHEAGIGVDAGAAGRGAEFLERHLVEAESRPDLAAWLLHALAEHLHVRGAAPRAPELVRAAGERLWARHAGLTAYGRALFAIAAHRLGQEDRAAVLADNLANGVVLDRSPDVSLVGGAGRDGAPFVQPTAHWGATGLHWRWWESGVESTATALRALLLVAPEHELVGPAVTWLVRNRRGAQWSSTRDTALAVLALERYLRASGELAAELDATVWVNGTQIASRRFAPADVLAAPARFEVDPSLLRDGANEVRVRASDGRAPYFAVEARFFSVEDPIRPAGNEVFVRRELWRLVPEPTLLRGVRLDRRALAEGEALESGARVEVVLTVEAKNDLEYLILEDLKPGGLESVALRSGGDAHIRELRRDALDRRLGARAPPGADEDTTGRARRVHQELRDRAVVFFVDALPQGIWELRYELRAEVPGRFHALPALAQAMYVPEIRGNGRSTTVEIR